MQNILSQEKYNWVIVVHIKLNIYIYVIIFAKKEYVLLCMILCVYLLVSAYN